MAPSSVLSAPKVDHPSLRPNECQRAPCTGHGSIRVGGHWASQRWRAGGAVFSFKFSLRPLGANDRVKSLKAKDLSRQWGALDTRSRQVLTPTSWAEDGVDIMPSRLFSPSP